MSETVKSELLKEQYSLIHHKSGLEVYVFPKRLSSSYAMIATKFGSIDNCFRVGNEKEFTTVPDGVAHFLEHKMFENEDGEDTFVKFSRTGADGNAYTTFNGTTYLFSCTDKLCESLEILLKSTFNPYFTVENVKKEQGIIAQEIRMGEDNPSNALLYNMLRCLYKKSSLRIDIAGTVESISEITPEILYKCHSAFYNPDNMILCVCGQTDENEIMRVVDSVLGDYKPVKVESKYASETEEAFIPRIEVKMQVAKPLFCIGVKDVDISPDPVERMRNNAAFQLISSMYFGKISDFYEKLYNDGLISPSFGCWNMHNRAFSFFSVSGDSSDPDEIFRRFTEYTEKIVSEPIDTDVFERCRRANYSGFIKEFDSTEEIANNLIMDFAVDGGEIFAYAEILRTITPEYVKKIAASLFRPSAYAMSVVYPV